MTILNTPLHRILFLDIETVSQFREYTDLPTELVKHWNKKAHFIHRHLSEVPEEEQNEIYRQTYKEKAGIYAEFSKIVCISLGVLDVEDDKKELRIKSIYGDDEKAILMAFTQLINQYYSNPKNSFFCGHNIREFDMPFICRRMIVNGLKLPEILQIAGKKPWEVPYFLDTLELWKFGDYKHFISLDLLAAILGISSPKGQMDGSHVGHVYWEEQGLDRIVEYCEKDVLTVVQVYLAMRYEPGVLPEHVFSLTFDEEE